MPDNQGNIIIKKVKKVQGGGHHGGAWKVAFADFMTAMMAFFMVMWLVSMLPPQKKSELAMFFRKTKFFPIMQEGDSTTSGGGQRSTKQTKPGEFTKANAMVDSKNLQTMLRDMVEIKLKDLNDYVAITVTEEGVRVDIIDQEGRLMFPKGSPELKPQAKRIVDEVGKVLRNIGNRVAIEGHTDAMAFGSGNYTNWELSTDRASVARREIERMGVDPGRISMVAGYAATKPIIPENPDDPRNRRISIVILFPPSESPANKVNAETVTATAADTAVKINKEVIDKKDNPGFQSEEGINQNPVLEINNNPEGK